MSKPSTPQYPSVQAAQVPTGSDLYGQGVNFLNSNGLGYTLTAQNQALQNANNPNYYASFQPSSFQQALANQSFSNIWPNELAAMQNQEGLSGQAYSPGASEAIGNAYGNLGTGIGEYLSQQGLQEAQTGINAGLGISPNEVLSPYVNTAAGQADTQDQLNQQANLTNAAGSYANQLANYNQQNALNSSIGTGVGALGGFALGGIPGAALGAGLGGTLMGGQIAGGANSMFPYMMASQAFSQGTNTQPFGGLFSGASGQGQPYQGYNLNYASPNTGYGSALSPYSAPNVSGVY